MLRRPIALLLCTLSLQLGWTQPVPNSDAPRLLQPGDQLEINIFSLPEIEKKYLIRADGTFFHPFAGQVLASGRSLAQLEADLQQRFRKQLKKPTFRLGLTSVADAEAAVLGEVRNQGKYKIVSGANVMDLLAQAGGTTEKADEDGLILLRAGKQVKLSLSPTAQSSLSQLQLRNGDILYVNRGKRVGVAGEVQLKGIYVISSKSAHPIEDAIKAAGGAGETAALNRVQIIRPSLAKPIDVNMLEPETAAKIGLEDGDTLVLPPRRAVVLGAVAKPGPVPLAGRESLLDIISNSGLQQGRLDAVVVIRSADVMAGNDKKEVYNLEIALGETTPVVNVGIHDGDVVYVPHKETGNGLLGDGQGIMSILFMARSFLSL